MNTMDTLRVRVLRVCSALSGLAVEFRRSFRTPVFMELNKRPTFALARTTSLAHASIHASTTNGVRCRLRCIRVGMPGFERAYTLLTSGTLLQYIQSSVVNQVGPLVSDKPQQLSNARLSSCVDQRCASVAAAG